MGTVGSRFEISTERVLHRRTERVAGDHHAVFVLHPENGRAGDVGGSVDRGGGTVSGGRKERSDAQISNLAKREHDDVTVASMCPFHSCRSRSIGG